MRRVEYIGEGAFSKRLPYAAFFGSFLGGARKEHNRTIVYKKVCFCKNPVTFR